MALYDRSRLAELASLFLHDQEIKYRKDFYGEAYKYAKYLANSYAKKIRHSWVKYTDSPAPDASIFAIEQLIAYIESKRFPAKTWENNLLACITKFLKCRIQDATRKEMSRFRYISQVDLENHTSQVAGEFDELEDSVYSTAFKDMKIQAVAEALNKVPEDLKNIYELRFGEGLSPRDIARKQGVPVSKIYGKVAQLKVVVKNNLSCVLSA